MAGRLEGFKTVAGGQFNRIAIMSVDMRELCFRPMADEDLTIVTLVELKMAGDEVSMKMGLKNAL